MVVCTTRQLDFCASRTLTPITVVVQVDREIAVFVLGFWLHNTYPSLVPPCVQVHIRTVVVYYSCAVGIMLGV